MIGRRFPEETPGRVPERTLREFAGLCLLIFGVLCALSWYRHQHGPSRAGWIAGILALLVGVPGLIRPNGIRPVYLGAMALSRPIGHVVGLVLLAVVYYGVMTPLAIAFRLTGRDGLGRFRRGAESYWVDLVPTRDVRLYLQQYQRQAADDRTASATKRATAPAPRVAAELSASQSPAFPGASRGSTRNQSESRRQ
jgi:hypothetical protein